MVVKQNKDIILALRVTSEEYSPFKDEIKASKLTRSAYFRKLLMSKKGTVIINVKDTRELLYKVNKAGNNINQLALKVNMAHKNGTISDKKYTLFLNALLSIEALMKKAVENAD